MFFTDEVQFPLSGHIIAYNNKYQINPRQTFETPSFNQEIGLWCAITATKTMGPSSLNRLLIQDGMSVMFLGPFLKALWKEEVLNGYFVKHDEPYIQYMKYVLYVG